MKPLRSQLRVEDPVVAACLLHPLRSRMLELLRTPRSATEIARELGLPAPRVNHHVQQLRRTGLVRRAGSRRIRNLNEILYQAAARTFVVGESITPGGQTRREVRTDEARRPLRNLVSLGERLSGDALQLLDEAAAGEREVSAFATMLDLSFADARSRAAFLADLLETVKTLRARYGAAGSDPLDERYRAIVACYPEVRV